ncbi:hypothetical protein LCGC14_2362800 [marine sediment metagenome]|uniref:Uncharacterized protein n=1 Tax=marine sediment metagenome TaxID=412755 RepID=A0A0F9EII9_9ZZZZ
MRRIFLGLAAILLALVATTNLSLGHAAPERTMSDDTLRIVNQPGNILRTVQNMIDQDGAGQLFRATVVATTDTTIRIQRTGHDPDTAEYAVLDNFPYPKVDDEVLVARVGSGWMIVGSVLRSGLTENYLTIETTLRILPGGQIQWGTDGLNSIDEDLITIEVSDDEGNPTDVMLFKRGAFTHRIVMTASVKDTPDLDFWDIVARSTAGFNGGRISVQAGSTVDENRAALVASDMTGAIIAAILSFGNGENRFDGLNRDYGGDLPLTALTIDAAGAIDITRSNHIVDTFGAAATDNLDNINAAPGRVLLDGMHFYLRAADGAHTIVARDGVGNVQLAGGVNFSLDSTLDILHLFYDGVNGVWIELSRANNG